MLSSFSTSISKYYKPVVIVPPDPNLINYFNFDTVYDSSGGPWTSGVHYLANTASGTIGPLYRSLNSATAYQSTITKKWGTGSMYTNNGTFRNDTNNYTFPENTGLSFSFWVYNIISGNTYSPLFGYATTASDQQVALRMVSNGNPPYSINLCVDNSTPPDSGGTTVTGGTLNANQWYHIAWTISSAAYGATATHKIYLDNVLIYTNAALKYPGNYLRKYQDLGSQAGWGVGAEYIDTFRYYNKTLTAGEVSNIYTNLDPNNVLI